MSGPRLCFDEDVNVQIVRGLVRRLPGAGGRTTTVREQGLTSRHDCEILAWAASQDYVVATHDASTMTRHASDRVGRGEPMPGLVVIPQDLAVGRAIAELQLILDASEADEWRNLVTYLPLSR